MHRCNQANSQDVPSSNVRAWLLSVSGECLPESMVECPPVKVAAAGLLQRCYFASWVLREETEIPENGCRPSDYSLIVMRCPRSFRADRYLFASHWRPAKYSGWPGTPRHQLYQSHQHPYLCARRSRNSYCSNLSHEVGNL